MHVRNKFHWVLWHIHPTKFMSWLSMCRIAAWSKMKMLNIESTTNLDGMWSCVMVWSNPTTWPLLKGFATPTHDLWQILKEANNYTCGIKLKHSYCKQAIKMQNILSLQLSFKYSVVVFWILVPCITNQTQPQAEGGSINHHYHAEMFRSKCLMHDL